MAEQIVVSELAQGYLNATRPWVRFLSILGFIGITLMVLGGLFLMLSGTPPTMAGQPAPFAGFGRLMGFIYLVMAALYFMPCLFLYRYGTAIAAIPATGQGALEDALKNQKSFFKFMGILFAVIVSIEVLFILIGILVALVAAAAHH